MQDSFWKERVRQVDHYRWIIMVPLALAFLISYFHRVATGVVADSLVREFDIVRASDLGILSSIYFYTYAVLQLPAGILADTYGPRRTITFAVFIAAIGTILFGWAPTYNWLFAARFIISLGVAFIFINMAKVFTEWFRMREFGTMSGLSGFIGNAGSILAATPLALLVENVGWRDSFYIFGTFSLCVSIYCWIVIRDRPTALGWPAMNEIEVAEGLIEASSPPQEQVGIRISIRTVWANWYTWPPFFASAGLFGAYMALAGVWGVPYFMQVYGMSRVMAANYIIVFAIGYMLTGPIVGYLSDRLLSRRWPYVFTTAYMLTGWMILTLWNGGKPPEWALYPLCLIIGGGASGVSMTLACAKEVNRPDMIGIAFGTANIGGFVGAALLQPAFGLVLDLNWQGAIVDGVKIYPQEAFQYAFFLCAAVLTAALVFALMIRETGCTNIAHLLLKDTQESNYGGR